MLKFLNKRIIKYPFIIFFSFASGILSYNFAKENIYEKFLFFHRKVFINQYKSIECPKASISIALFGQSNSANTVLPKSNLKIPQNLYQYNWRTNKCYFFKEPLLGTMGLSGNSITYTAVKLARENPKPVIVIPFGVDGSSVIEWSYGYLNNYFLFVISQLKKDEIYPNIFLWHQGETDSKKNHHEVEQFKNIPAFRKPKKLELGLNKDIYKNALQNIYEISQENFPNSKFGIGLVSICNNKKEWEPIRSAQMKVAKDNLNAFISADSDKIREIVDRLGCHFTSIGAKKLGEEYYLSIKNNFLK